MSDSNHPERQGDNAPEVDDSEIVDAHIMPPRHAGPHRRLDFNQTRYVSQLPPPDDLERYAALLPDAPERMLAGGEREQAHRHQIESRMVGLDEVAMPKFYRGQQRGHLISLALGLGYEAVMAIAVFKGYAVEGIFGAAFGIGAMVWALRRDPSGRDTPAKPDQDATAGDSPDDGSAT